METLAFESGHEKSPEKAAIFAVNQNFLAVKPLSNYQKGYLTLTSQVCDYNHTSFLYAKKVDKYLYKVWNL